LLAAGLSGCAASALQQARIADDLHDDDVAVAQYTQALRGSPHSVAAQAGLDRAKLRASDAHLLRGRQFYNKGRYDDAMVELQLAFELNPANTDAERELRAVRAALRARLATPADGPTSLESLLARTRDAAPAGHELPDVTLPGSISTGRQTTSRELFLMIGQLGNLSVTFDSAFRDAPAQVSLLTNMKLKPALDAIAASTNTFYQVTGTSAILVVDDTPAKRRQYTDDVERQFIIQNVDVKETIDMLHVVSDARYISPISGTNAIVVRDTAERVQLIGRLLGAIDKARPEVVIDVEILEVNRSRLQEYGLQIASPGSPGLDGSADANRAGLTLESLRNLGQSGVLITNIPALYYRLLKTDVGTRTLANPHIRILDGKTASANFGEEVPVPQVVITPIATGGVNVQPQTQFQYRKVGVNITITPRTHPNDEVTLDMNVELSSLGSPGFSGLPTFGSRNVTTALRLRDGETNILAGLIRDDERVERQSYPGVGKIPILGQLLAKNHKERQQTDVVLMLTPHIIRVLALTEDDLRPLKFPREGGGASLLDSAPIVLSVPIKDPAPVEGPAAPPSLPVTAGLPAGLPTTPVIAPKIIKR
jgi:general secretion pathway protein D